jgi:hypothetical protein
MAEHYTSDQLQEPIQIIRKSREADGAGGFTETEVILPSPTTYHMAKVRPLRGQERLTNEQVQAEGGVLFVLYSAVDVRARDVILYNAVRYNVGSLPPPGLSRFREVEATSGGIV